MNKEDVLEKACKTPYRHKNWFLEGGKSVYDAMLYFSRSGDFSLDFSSRIRYTSQIPGYKGIAEKSEIIKWLIQEEMYNMLIIRYAGKERGTDRGVLKVKTFIALSDGYNS